MTRSHLPLALLSGLAIASLACDSETPTKIQDTSLRVPPGTNLFLISVDTLRADRLPIYGYDKGSTPAIDALAADSVVFERAYSHTPLTLPSHATVLTGRLPVTHGIHDNLGFTLDETVATLPALLREAGYRTAAAVSAYALPAKSGLGRGFDLYEDNFRWQAGSGLGEVQRPGAETLDLLRPWLRSESTTQQRRPLFALFHLYEPHSPYKPPSDLASRFEDPYDGEIAAADRVVGAFLEELEKHELYEQSLIVLFSDHGEGLGDHGEEEHGLLLYPETLQVPLLIKLPESIRGGTHRTDPVGLVDLLPTLGSLLGLQLPDDLTGRALLEVPSGGPPVVSETLYPRVHFGWSELVSVIDGDLFYVHGPDPELFDLSIDPSAKHNLRDERRRDLKRLREIALNYGLDPTKLESSESSTEDLAALAALGYVSTGATIPPSGDLPDPKSKVHSLADLTAGFRQFHEGNFAAAAATLSRALESNPGLVHAWEYLARAHHNAGDLEAALEAYLRAVALTTSATGSASVQNSAPAVMILLRLERTEEASRLIRDQLSRDPSERRLQDLEIRTLLMMNATDVAQAKARRLAESRPEDPSTLYQFAVALALNGEIEEARETLRQVLEIAPDHSSAKADLEKLSVRP